MRNVIFLVLFLVGAAYSFSNKVTLSYNQGVDSVFIVTIYSDSGTTVYHRDTSTGASVIESVTVGTKYLATVKGGTGTQWSSEGAITPFYVSKVTALFTFSWTSIDSVYIVSVYSDSGITLFVRDTTTALTIQIPLYSNSHYWYTLKGETGTTWSTPSAIVGFYTGSGSGTSNGFPVVAGIVIIGIGIGVCFNYFFRRR